MADRADAIDVEIAVVGGGPTGLAAALALARSGATVALIAPPAPATDHRTTALLSGSVEVLDRIGAYAAFSSLAAPLRTMRLVDGTKRLVRAPEIAFHASELGLDAFGVNVANRDFVAGLAAALAEVGDRIRRIESTLDTVAVEDGRIQLRTTDGDIVTARLTVGADGRNSAVRQAAGIRAKTWSYPQTALVLNLRHKQPHYDASTEIHTETGPFTLVPLGPGRSSLVCVETPDVAERLAAMPDEALAADLERRSHSILGRLEIDSPRQTWPMSSLSVDRMVADRVALVGEAAHAFPPIGAQGLNLGIRDIAALADIVGRARARGDDVGGPGVLDRYASARRTDVLTRTFGVDLLNRSLLTDFLPVQVARSVAMQIARDVGPLRKLMMREGLRPRLFRGA
ncbi:MAG TPA: UbiH/UbiF family hydroxylase [Methylomirabilota bacterium]|nr:UbiH/UbiF family hydroxylase [Methylomirabilota bacterium]